MTTTRTLALVTTLCWVLPLCRAQPAGPGDLPRHAVRVLGTDEMRPASPALGMALLAPGKQVVLTTLDGVTAWGLESGRPRGAAALPPREPLAIGARAPIPPPESSGRICPMDGRKSLALLKDGWVYRYELPLAGRPPTRLPTLPGSSGAMTALVPVGPDATLFGVTTQGELRSFDSSVSRWKLVAGDLGGTKGGPPLAVGTALVAAGDAGGRLRLWRFDPTRSSGAREAGAFDTEPVQAAAVSADDRVVVAVGQVGRTPPRTVRAWDAKAGKQLGKWDIDGGGFDAIALSPDGAVLAAANRPRRGEVTLYDARTGEVRCALSAAGDHIRFLAFPPRR